MKKSILILGFLALMSGAVLTAQVGINTDNPTNTLHIVGDTANVKGQAFRLVDGNEQDSAVLVGDENGAGTWMSQDELLANMPYVEIDSLFTICPGWKMMQQAAQRYGKMIQFRIKVRNTAPVTFNSNHSPTSNSLVAIPFITTYRYMVYTSYTELNYPYRLLHFFLGQHSSNDEHNTMVVRKSDSNEDLPVGTEFVITGFFMFGRNIKENGVWAQLFP